MKLRNFLAMMAVAFCTMGVTACDDDDDDYVPTAADVVKGVYEGEVNMSVMNEDQPTIKGTTTVKAQSNGKVELTLPQMSMNMGPKPVVMPAVKVSNVEIKKVAENKFELEVGAFNQVIGDKNFKSTGLKGVIEGNEIELNYDMTPGAMPFPIITKFEGKKK